MRSELAIKLLMNYVCSDYHFLSEVQQGEERQREEVSASIDSSGTTMTPEVDEEVRIEQQERMARQRLMNLRRASEEKKRDKSNSFRSKASKKLEKMEQKELKLPIQTILFWPI